MVERECDVESVGGGGGGELGLHFFEKKFIFKRLKFLKHVLLLVFYSQEINILKIRF